MAKRHHCYLLAALLVGCGTNPPAESSRPSTHATTPMTCGPAPILADQQCLMGADPQAPPLTLSAANCFSDLSTRTPGPDLVPYDVAAPLFTDGSDKGRWLVLPPGTKTHIDEDGLLDFPEGSVLVKQFDVDTTTGVRAMETRIMLRTDRDWALFTYVWREDGSDADLATEPLSIALDTAGGTLQWLVPTVAECGYCHGAEPDVLGPVQIQLDRDVCVGDQIVNQLDAFEQWGLLEQGGARSQALVSPFDETLPVALRARSYLHANCAHCHEPGGWTSPGMNMYLDYRLPLADTHTCGEPIQFLGQLGEDFRILPGDPESSHVFTRMRGDGLGKMPGFGERTDPDGMALIRDWITEMEDCDEPE